VELRLLVGRDVRELTAIRHLILDAITWGLAITVGLALFGGWLMGAGIVRRLDVVNQVSREIMRGDLSRRVPSAGTGDDFDQLAENLNRMLERIEALMLSIRQVSDNIAHDLRTPLTRLRNRLELLQGADLNDEASAEVEVAIADADELLSAFNALLRIARIEAGSRRAAFADLDPLHAAARRRRALRAARCRVVAERFTSKALAGSAAQDPAMEANGQPTPIDNPLPPARRP
jgi:signal transduction histidine kinase